ncbi:MAG: hypothetical protein J5485_03315, partial [Candidatus Methanomethylophilaceae archaeon]|nr:hypothetical protein [Candidatus Methanomethylophilaceae archaeon]
RFGKECLRGDLLDKIVVLGNNNSGKTSFGYAITDIVSTVGGFSKDIGQRNEGCFLTRTFPWTAPPSTTSSPGAARWSYASIPRHPPTPSYRRA